MIFDGTIDWINATDLEVADLRVLLLTASYTPDESDAFVADLTGELSGGGYARLTLPGVTLAGPVESWYTLDAADVVFPLLELAAGQPRYAVVYAEGDGTDAGRPLVALLDLGASAAIPRSTHYTVRWPPSGIVRYA